MNNNLMKTLAVLITAYNRKEKTLKCLQLLKAQLSLEGYQVDIYLTDDGCTDGTPEAIRKLYPQVHIVSGNGNLFWNRGMYTAWKEAAKNNYDFYLWLNDDTYLYPNSINKAIKESERHENKAIIVGATSSRDHSQITYGGRLANGKIAYPSDKIIEVSFFNGNFVLVPKYVYKNIGNLDYTYHHSKGDFDYGMRAVAKGIKIFQLGEIIGECDLHDQLDGWCNPNIPFKKRLKLLRMPNGMPPYETFYFESKHYNVLIAAFHYCTIYIRCFFPNLWVLLNKAKL